MFLSSEVCQFLQGQCYFMSIFLSLGLCIVIDTDAHTGLMYVNKTNECQSPNEFDGTIFRVNITSYLSFHP